MKRKNLLAVVATIVAFCSVIMSCSSYEAVADDDGGIISPVREKSCNFIGLSTPETGGAITRSATDDIDFTTPDGRYSVTTKAKMTFANTLPEDSVKWHEIIHNLIPYGIFTKPLYIRDLDKFMNTKPTITSVQIPDGRMGYWINNEGANKYILVEENSIDSDSTYVRDINGKLVWFVRCKDFWIRIEFVGRTGGVLEGTDNPDWKKRPISDEFQPYLSSGLKCPTFKVNYTSLVWSGKGDPEYPDDNWDVVKYFTKNEWINYVDPNTANTGFEAYAWLSDGSEKFYRTKDVDLSNSIEVQKRDTITTTDFNWKELDAVLYNEGTDGALYEKKDSIWVQPLKRTYQPNINKGSREYLLKREGRAYWTDPFGEKHYFKEAEWETANADKGWEKSDLAADNTYNYILLTSSIAPTYLEYEHKTSSELALRKLKDEANKLLECKIMNYNIRKVNSITNYFTYGELWGIYSQGEPKKLGEIGTHIGVDVTTPAEQTIDVTDWNINNKSAQWYGEQRLSARTDTIKDGDHVIGVFHITPVKKTYVTQTNKSDDKFYVTWDKVITFTDEFGKDFDGFITLDPIPSDKGGVGTLTDLSDENNYERKQMTTTMNLVVRDDNADYTGTVIFRKEKEKEPDPNPKPDFPFDANWHADKANRFYTESQWADGFLYSNDEYYFIVAYFFDLNKSATSESPAGVKTYTYPKSTFETPSAGREYDAVMWDPTKQQAIPCRILIDGNGWTLGTRYADKREVSKSHVRQEAVNSGVKNLAEHDNATPSPIIATTWWSETVNEHIYYHAVWKTTTHNMSHCVGFKAE